MKLRDLESALCNVKQFENPVVELEQYPTSPHLAAQVVHTMDSVYDDISGKLVCDLGCGTGILAIASAIMGAQCVIGVDIDDSALNIAAENVRDTDVEEIVDLACTDVAASEFISAQPSKQRFDTVVMNPPFGTKRKGVDMVFLQCAVQLAECAVYSMHKSSTRQHITKKTSSWGVQAQVIAELRFDIDHLYEFHKSKSVDIHVDLWRIDTSSKPLNIEPIVPSLPSREEAYGRLKSARHRSRIKGKRNTNR